MRVNIFGGPCVGKSTIASWLFSQLKEKGIQIELVTEYIKSWVWENRTPTSYDQLYIFAKQLRAEDIITRRGIHIITDSPLPLQLVYVKRHKCAFYDHLYSICREFDADHPSFNILLGRTVPYDEKGRYQTLVEAKDVDIELYQFLVEYQQPYHFATPDRKEELLDKVLTHLQRAQK